MAAAAGRLAAAFLPRGQPGRQQRARRRPLSRPAVRPAPDRRRLLGDAHRALQAFRQVPLLPAQARKTRGAKKSCPPRCCGARGTARAVLPLTCAAVEVRQICRSSELLCPPRCGLFHPSSSAMGEASRRLRDRKASLPVGPRGRGPPPTGGRGPHAPTLPTTGALPEASGWADRSHSPPSKAEFSVRSASPSAMGYRKRRTRGTGGQPRGR